MQAIDTARNTKTPTLAISNTGHTGATYTKVLNGRKQPIRGLWQRGERFYAQLTFEDANTGKKSVRRVPLLTADKEPVATVAEAVKALDRLKTQREENTLPVLTRTPTLAECGERYFKHLESLTGAKRASTVKKEQSAFELWKKELGHVRVD